jgi:hypothetical protein
MYSFVTLFGVLALLTQLRVIRRPSMVNWAVYILSTAALLWSHYFGLLLIAVQQVIFLVVLNQRRRSDEQFKPLLLGYAYSAAVLVLQFVPLLGRGGSRQTMMLAVAALVPLVLLLIVSTYDRTLFEVRYFLIVVPLLLLLVARLVTGWIRKPRARLLVAGGVVLTLLIGLADQQTDKGNPRLFDFRGAIKAIKADAGPKSLILYEPPDMRYVLEYYAPNIPRKPLSAAVPKRREGFPEFVLASFQDNKQFFDETNKVVGQLDFFRPLVEKVNKPQTVAWEFR